MATDFPGAVDTTSKLPNPTTSNNTNNPSHAGLHDNVNDAIKAAETKIGTGATTPASNTLLVGTGAGASAWQGLTSAQLAAILSDETGTGSAVFATTPTLVTPKVDTINESTLNNGVTVGGVNLKAGVNTTSSSIPTAALQDGAVTNAKVAAGAVVQVVNFETGTLATGTTLVPFDNTIPQNTEGDQYMSLAITPKATTNLLIIDVVANLGLPSVQQNAAGALFQDTTASAIATSAVGTPSANAVTAVMSFKHKMPAGTTSATTFKFRAGVQVSGTLTFNGIVVGAFFGGTYASSITITEIKV